MGIESRLWGGICATLGPILWTVRGTVGDVSIRIELVVAELSEKRLGCFPWAIDSDICASIWFILRDGRLSNPAKSGIFRSRSILAL